MQQSEIIAWAVLAAAGCVGVFATASYAFRRYKLSRPSYQYLLDRAPEPGRWQAEYPGETEFVTTVLASLVDAFMLRDDDIYRLQPDDSLMAIYRAAYPATDIPDQWEFETLHRDLKRRYGVSDTEADRVGKMTVRDVIEVALGARSRRTRG